MFVLIYDCTMNTSYYNLLMHVVQYFNYYNYSEKIYLTEVLWFFSDLFILIAFVFCSHVYLYELLRSPATRVTDSCELPYVWWELNPDPLEKQQGF